MDENLLPESTVKHFYFFVNSKSGDNEGAKLLSLSKTQQLVQALPINLTVNFIDLHAREQLRNSLEAIG